MSSKAEQLVVEVLVDDSDHALLAVVASRLGTVVPDGLLVLNDDLEDLRSLVLLGWEAEPREETGVASQGLAGLGE